MDADEQTLNAYLDEWLEFLRTRVEAMTLYAYRAGARTYLRPGLGGQRIGDLTVRMLNLHYVRLLESGGRRGGPLSRRTVAQAHSILRTALAHGVKQGVLRDNVADRATVPRIHPGGDPASRVGRVWDATQAQRFLELAASHPLYDLWRAALGTGMRRGELLGLRWQDVDLAVPQVRVMTSLVAAADGLTLKATKSGNVRVLHLDDRTAAAIGRQPRRQGAWPLVFTQPDGRPWRPSQVSTRWAHQWPEIDVPKLRFHDLRHCHATLLLDQRVPMKVVSARLGHVSITTTMDLYAHVLPAQDLDAATAIGRVLGGRQSIGDLLPRQQEQT